MTMVLNELVLASVNRQHAKIRAMGERAVATLKTWKIVTKLHCSPHHGTGIVQAILSSSTPEVTATHDEYDSLYDPVLADSGIEVVRSGVRVPRMSAIMDRGYAPVA
jgi:hypothetical protein